MDEIKIIENEIDYLEFKVILYNDRGFSSSANICKSIAKHLRELIAYKRGEQNGEANE